MLRYGVGVGVGVMRISGRRFVALLARRVQKDERRMRISFGTRRLWRGCGCGWCFCGGWTCTVACCRWYQCGIKVGLCAGRVGAMPLLVLRHGGQGVKRGLLGLQKLQLKTVLITEGHVAKCELLEARLGEAGDRPRLPGLYDVNIFKRHISHMRCSAAVYGGFAGIC